jgi:glycosyltransferase involved in cell wall biosynthesis
MKPMHNLVQVSVIMATYNAQTYLAEAIDSVLNQSFTNFEFLIHDDGSSDETLTILRDYAAQDDRVVVSSGPNRGLSASLNQLVESARGDLLARMDADDICLPDRLEKQMAG